MLEIKREGIILESSNSDFDFDGVLNPAIFQMEEDLYMIYRALGKDKKSSLGFCEINGPNVVFNNHKEPILYPEFENEIKGIEDPRIVLIADTFFLSYTAYDGVNALGALATSKNLKKFKKIGLITPQIHYASFLKETSISGPLNEKYSRYNKRESIKVKHQKQVYVWVKNIVFFPKKIDNKIHFLIRIKPDIQLVSIDKIEDLTPEFWKNYFNTFQSHILLEPLYGHEVSYIGGGCPPIETGSGWLLIYHGVCDSPEGYVYSICASLLDLAFPFKEKFRLPYPVLTPSVDYELKGEINNVCFPTGSAQFEGKLFIYYGAADKRIACISMNLNLLIEELLKNPKV